MNRALPALRARSSGRFERSRLALNNLESFRPCSESSCGRTTAAAITGPAQAPTPTSSTPAMGKVSAGHNCCLNNGSGCDRICLPLWRYS